MRLLGCCLLLGGVFFVSTAALAQDAPDQTDTEAARVLFGEGLEFVEAEDWSRAAERFRGALRLRDSPAISYNLAAALFQLGQLNEAEELVVAVRDDASAPDQVRQTASELAERIPQAGGELTVRIDGDRSGVEVYLDDRQVAPFRWDHPMTASLGAHELEARRDGVIVARNAGTVSADEPIEVTLTLPTADLAEDAAGDGAGSDELIEESEGSLLGDWRFWAAVGGGVLLVATIVIIAVAVGSQDSVQEPVAGDFEPGVLTWR